MFSFMEPKVWLLEQMWTAGEYYSMVVFGFCLGVGAIFQFPLVLVLLCYVGILSTEVFARAAGSSLWSSLWWRH